MKYDILQRIRAMTDAQLVEVLFRMAEEVPDVFDKHIRADVPIVVTIRNGYSASFTRAQYYTLKNLSQSPSNKITLIKEIRSITGASLRDAKDMSEEHFGL